MKKTNFAVVLALALSFVLVLAVLPAAAKGKPKPPPALYDITLSLAAGAEGLGMCGDPGEPLSLAMSGTHDALVADGTGGTWVPRLHLRASVPATRTHGYVADNDANTFDGCHGGALDESESDVPSYFVIHADRSGNVAGVLWAFDVYVEEGIKGKKEDRTPGVKEFFRLWSTDEVSFTDGDGNDCPLTPAESVTCLVSGPFEVWHYYPIEQIGVDRSFTFALTIEPR